MILERFLQKLGRIQTPGDQLDTLARDIGHELPRRRLDLLTELRAALAGAIQQKSDNHVRTALQAHVQMLSAYITDIEDEHEREEALAECAQQYSKLAPLLEAIGGNDASVSEHQLAAQLGVKTEVVQAAAQTLKRLGMVEIGPCCQPGQTLYRLSAWGEEAITRLSNQS